MNEVLKFMYERICAEESYGCPWKVVAMLDYCDVIFNKDTPEEEVKEIISRLQEDYDDYTLLDSDLETVIKSCNIYDSSDVDDMLSDARYEAISDEKWKIPEHLRAYMDWDSFTEEQYASIYDLFDTSDITEFKYEDDDDYYTRTLYIVEESW